MSVAIGCLTDEEVLVMTRPENMRIAGAGTLVKTGAGKLTLNGTVSNLADERGNVSADKAVLNATGVGSSLSSIGNSLTSLF